ncbi:MAG: cation-translocating P-type ATPase [Acidobacteria bacterium]|nr:cation-translocating P-type ATPase [Acidobacteriota bacterium]MBI3282050.1 cation-translocating P-type ATPase [Acidobacteriota bacterium]
MTAPDRDLEQLTGLTEEEAAHRRRLEGPNELPAMGRKGFRSIATNLLREPLFVLLAACSLLYLFLGEAADAIALLACFLLVAAITIVEQDKTERALEALRELGAPLATVIRNGRRRRIPSREVVRGDLVVVAEGERIPADALVISSASLAVDESLLTGESVPVRKAPVEGPLPARRPGGDDQPFLYSGTLVVQGHGLGQVLAVGRGTEIGAIGEAMRATELEESRVSRDIRRAVRLMGALGAAVCVTAVLLYGFSRGDWVNALLGGLSLAMAMVPEEFVVILTVFFALGAWRISKQKVLARRMPAIEALGAATTLCIDKTGTLTTNTMSVERLWTNGQTLGGDALDSGEMPEHFHKLVEFGMLAGQEQPFDPMEKAFLQMGWRQLADTEHIHTDWVLVREYPLSRSMLAVSHVWKSADGEEYVIAAKGAPEAILDLCHMEGEGAREVLGEAQQMAERGLRVLGVAKAEFPRRALPVNQHDFEFSLLGLIAFADPVRPGVAGAVHAFQEAGIRVVIITGDYLATAQNIARQAGLLSIAGITGPQMTGMSDEELERRASTAGIFARVTPDQKLRLVNAFKARGEVVAMTGDGVNDAPALRAAHIGVAMGRRGTDVAREAAALVLLDDDFASLVGAISLGRRIYGNLEKASTYVVASHVLTAGLALAPAVIGWPLALLPVHVAALELIIDPACSLVFEAEPAEEDVMRRPPRDPKASLFHRRMLLFGLVQGLAVLAAALAVFGGALYSGHSEGESRALAFAAATAGNLGLILVNRSWSQSLLARLRIPNVALHWILGLVAIALAAAVYTPFLARIFHFAPVAGGPLLFALASGFLSALWFELWKMPARRRVRK